MGGSREAEIVATGGDGLEQATAEDVVALILGEIEF